MISWEDAQDPRIGLKVDYHDQDSTFGKRYGGYIVSSELLLPTTRSSLSQITSLYLWIVKLTDRSNKKNGE